jgi:DNA topoisomerase VI subunit A
LKSYDLCVAYEDPVMKIAIPTIFKNTQHRYYRFHVTHSWSHELDMLYATHKGLKVELESLFNFPLGPTEFEKVWGDTVDKYRIKEHPAIKSLWNKKEMWIMAYCKGLYCGWMTSTQRSESANRVLKVRFVNRLTSLHQFTEKMLEALQHMDHIEAREIHYSHVRLLYK